MRKGIVLSWLLVAVFFVAVFPSIAKGQVPPPGKLDVHLFKAAVGGKNFVTVYGTEPPGHLGYGVGVLFSYANKPFVLQSSPGGDPLDGEQTPLVERFFAAELYGYLGLTPYLSVGISAPIAPYLSGETPNEVQTDSETESLEPFAWGDVGLHVKGEIYRLEQLGLSFGAVLSVTFPTGKYAEAFYGKKNVGLVPRAVVSFERSIVSAAVNLGAVLRTQPVTFYDETFEIGQQFLYAGALGVEVYDDVQLFAELTGRTAFDAVDTSPLEAVGGVRWEIYRGLGVDVGGGGGIVAGIGAPLYRFFLGVHWTPSFKDSDNDGVADDDDQCPGQKEDRDGFKDHDGCPDRDNDGDGQPDGRDRCPGQAEDFDGYEDDDGCPEPDNDGDGVCDANETIQKRVAHYGEVCSGRDQCPMNKGPAKQKGCPASMLDSDDDGVADAQDQCPDKPEDLDGHEDEDGCVDPDNDGDGFCDANDAVQGQLASFAETCQGKDGCSDRPEDKDGNEDDDGCPDPDDDGDGVCDANSTIQAMAGQLKNFCVGSDRCPRRKESINGRRDRDGCPDRGRPDVIVKGKRVLTPRRKIRFKSTSTEMRRPAKRVVEQLASVLRARQNIQRLVIVGFTDTLMGKQEALKVSQAWADAVKKALVARGIRAERLLAKGLGKAKPRYKGRSRRRQYRVNRRVEFYVVEPEESE
jgi:outer membrane protein OmpA-like peptidoglycan-associated protein